MRAALKGQIISHTLMMLGVIPLGDLSPAEVLFLAASAERYSEHPLAEAVCAAARAGLAALRAG